MGPQRCSLSKKCWCCVENPKDKKFSNFDCRNNIKLDAKQNSFEINEIQYDFDSKSNVELLKESQDEDNFETSTNMQG